MNEIENLHRSVIIFEIDNQIGYQLTGKQAIALAREVGALERELDNARKLSRVFEEAAFSYKQERDLARKAAAAWKPISVKPPEAGWYLGCYAGGFVDTWYYTPIASGEYRVDYWMKFPEPPAAQP